MYRNYWLARVCAGVLLATCAEAAPRDPIDVRAAKIVDAMSLAEQVSLLRSLNALSLANVPGAEALRPGETKEVTVTADPRILASWRADAWRQQAGSYDVRVSPSAELAGVHADVSLASH